jgi:hypothetical protein
MFRLKMDCVDRNVAHLPKTNFSQLNFELPPTIRRIARKIEFPLKKIINGEAAITVFDGRYHPKLHLICIEVFFKVLVVNQINSKIPRIVFR